MRHGLQPRGSPPVNDRCPDPPSCAHCPRSCCNNASTAVRPVTPLGLLRDRDIEPPATIVPALNDWFDARTPAGSLAEYLRGFTLTVAATATSDAMERVALKPPRMRTTMAACSPGSASRRSCSNHTA